MPSEEYARFIESALKLDVRVAAIVLLGGDAGLRSGEIRARPLPIGVAPADTLPRFGCAGS